MAFLVDSLHNRSWPARVLSRAMIDAWDRWAIQAWHEGWHPAALDAIAPWWRDRNTWIPLYAVLLVWLVYRQRRWGFYRALAIATAVGLADLTSARLLKPLFGRIRPCNLDGLKEHLDLLTGCGSGLSFPSNHATNHFAFAVAVSLLAFSPEFLGPRWRPLLKVLLVLWATSIALAQVYVGRHYPSDVLAGAGLGALIGWLIAKIFAALETRFRKTSHVTHA